MPFRFLRESQPTPLYAFLPHAVFAFFVISFLLHPLSPIYTHQLADPDDYMRLNETINWLKGQNWFDLGEPRLSPGAHTVIHWSRLVDLPLALVMLPFIKGFGMQGAALLASFVVPIALFWLLLTLLPALAAPLVGSDRANLAALFALFAPTVLFNFTPGRVDHHGWQILIAGFGLFALERMLNDEKGWRWGLLASLAFASGFWIGTEALPWVCIFLTCLALLAAFQGGFALRNAAFFGLAFPLATLIVLPLALQPEDFSSRALSWFSPAYVIFAACAGMALIALGTLGQLTRNVKLRLFLAVSLGFFAAVVFVYFTPDALIGPFADYEGFNATTALDNITEAVPLWHALRITPNNPLTYGHAFELFTVDLALPFAALFAAFYGIRTSKRQMRTIWILHAAYLGMALTLTLFWQVRVGYFMQLFTIAPLTWLLLTGWKKAGALKGRSRLWAEIGIFLLLGPLPAVFLPACFKKTEFYPDVVLFPAARMEAACPLFNTGAFLDRTYGDKNLTILAGMNEGPELLFLTPYKYIGGNYDVAGNPDVFAFFHAKDGATARAILRKWHVDLVLTCRAIPPFFAGYDHPIFGKNTSLRQGADGKLHLAGNPGHPALVEKLVNGPAPAWLKPIAIPDEKDYLLFKVR